MKMPRRRLSTPAGFAVLTVLLVTATARSSPIHPIQPVPDRDFTQIFPSAIYETPPPVAPIYETTPHPAHTPRPTPQQVPQATTAPPPALIHSSTRSLTGRASWFCLPGRSACTAGHSGGMYAAAGPKLRAALGNWRGRHIKVNGVPITIIDWCSCARGRSNERLIDLYADAYSAIKPLSTGVMRVTITW